jgi:hypothetical protein
MEQLNADLSKLNQMALWVPMPDDQAHAFPRTPPDSALALTANVRPSADSIQEHSDARDGS